VAAATGGSPEENAESLSARYSVAGTVAQSSRTKALRSARLDHRRRVPSAHLLLRAQGLFLFFIENLHKKLQFGGILELFYYSKIYVQKFEYANEDSTYLQIATTNWRRVFLVLTGQVAADMNEIIKRDPRDMTQFKTLRDYTPEQRVQMVNSFRKMLFARHPFHRLNAIYYDRLRYDRTISDKYATLQLNYRVANFNISLSMRVIIRPQFWDCC
jgi:hypothetical protein